MRRFGLLRRITAALAVIATLVLGGLLVVPITRAADLPPRPPINIPVRLDPPNATISVGMTAMPNTLAAPGSVVEVTLKIANHGRGAAKNSTVVLPFDPSVVSVVDATFPEGQAWVSELGENYLEVRTTQVDAKSSIVGTIRFRVTDTAPIGADVLMRATYRWADGDSRYSNAPFLAVGNRDLNRQNVPLAMSESPNGFYFYSNIFIPNEPVGLWYNTPDGQAVDLGIFFADNSGVIDLELLIGSDPPGDYSLVLYGNWSGLTSVGYYTLTP